ncbi:MAG: menaquinol oxidoreductase [Acidobacteria bacterium]|nr:menaquinol oxidoreductase [Acidobacteriota bacterium]
MPAEAEPRYRLLGVVPREGEVAAEREPEDTVFTWPHLLVRHAVVAAGVIVVVFALAIAFDAPLKEMANPNLTPPVAKAPWYFAGLQELLSHFHPMIAGVFLPTAAVLGLLLLPYLDLNPATEARARRVAVVTFTLLVVVAVLLTVVGAFFRGPGWSWAWPWQHLYLEL